MNNKLKSPFEADYKKWAMEAHEKAIKRHGAERLNDAVKTFKYYLDELKNCGSISAMLDKEAAKFSFSAGEGFVRDRDVNKIPQTPELNYPIFKRILEETKLELNYEEIDETKLNEIKYQCVQSWLETITGSFAEYRDDPKVNDLLEQLDLLINREPTEWQKKLHEMVDETTALISAQTPL